jgi:pilus assembly protein Flp/PilA
MLSYFNHVLAKLVGGAAVRREEGQTFVEYALLIAFIAVVALVAVQLLGSSVSSLFSSVAGSL